MRRIFALSVLALVLGVLSGCCHKKGGQSDNSVRNGSTSSTSSTAPRHICDEHGCRLVK